MGLKLSETPDTVKIRVWKHDNLFHVLERDGEGWESLLGFRLKEKALAFLENTLFNKIAEWSRNIKIRAGWVCRKCGEMDRYFLDSHHIKPREKFPELMYDMDNGELDCLWLHVFMHRDDIVAQNLILMRLVQKLTERLYRPLTKCQKMLFGITDEIEEEIGAQGGKEDNGA